VVLRLGIQHQRIRPGHAAAERRARAHAQDAQGGGVPPAEAHARAQQRRFDAFRAEYNAERPHAALGGATPASRYAPSPAPTPTGCPRWSTRALPRQARDQRRHHPLQGPPALPGQRPQAAPRRARRDGDGVWSLYLGPRAARAHRRAHDAVHG
jgi:hypothetical protein